MLQHTENVNFQENVIFSRFHMKLLTDMYWTEKIRSDILNAHKKMYSHGREAEPHFLMSILMRSTYRSEDVITPTLRRTRTEFGFSKDLW